MGILAKPLRRLWRQVKRKGHYLTDLLPYVVRGANTLTGGSYFAISSIMFIFFVYFRPIGGMLGLPAALLGIGICTGLFIYKGIREEYRDRQRIAALEARVDTKKDTLLEVRKQLNPTYKKIAKNKQTKTPPLSTRLWQYAQKALNRSREALNALRNTAKTLIPAFALVGLGIAPLFTVGVATLGWPIVATIVGICLLFAGAGFIDVHIKRSRRDAQRALHEKLTRVNNKVNAKKLALLPLLSAENQRAAEIEKALDSLTYKPIKPNRLPYSYGKFSVRAFVGAINGSYLALLAISVFFDTLFGALTGGAAILVPLISGGIFGLLGFYENTRREQRDQLRELDSIHAAQYYQNKITRLKNFAKHYGLAIKEYPAASAPSPAPAPQTMGNYLRQKVERSLNRFREGLRGARNATRVLTESTGILVGLGVIGAVSLTALAFTNPPLFVAFGLFSAVFGVSCAIDYHITKTRDRNIEQLAESNRVLMDKVAHYDREIRHANRTGSFVSPARNHLSTSAKRRVHRRNEATVSATKKQPDLAANAAFNMGTTPFWDGAATTGMRRRRKQQIDNCHQQAAPELSSTPTATYVTPLSAWQ